MGKIDLQTSMLQIQGDLVGKLVHFKDYVFPYFALDFAIICKGAEDQYNRFAKITPLASS